MAKFKRKEKKYPLSFSQKIANLERKAQKKNDFADIGYYCTKCKRKHYTGVIYENHAGYATVNAHGINEHEW